MPGVGLASKPGALQVSTRWRQQLDDCIISAAWSPDGQLLAAATVSGAVVVMDTATGAIQHQLRGHAFGATVVAWNRAGTRLASAGQDGKIQLWDAECGRQLVPVAGGSDWVEHLAWGPLDNCLASAAGRIVRLWNAEGELIHDYPALPNTVSALAWRPNSRRLAAASYGGIVMWEGEKLEPRRKFEWKGSVLTICWSPDGRYLATGDQDSTVHFWIARIGRDLQMFGYPRKVRELSWDSGSRYLATGGGADVTIWDCAGKGPEGSTPIVLRAHQAALGALAFQHLGQLLASADEDGDVCIWRPARNKKLLAQTGLKDGISHMSWSADDRLLALGGDHGELAVTEIG